MIQLRSPVCLFCATLGFCNHLSQNNKMPMPDYHCISTPRYILGLAVGPPSRMNPLARCSSYWRWEMRMSWKDIMPQRAWGTYAYQLRRYCLSLDPLRDTKTHR